MCGRPQRLWVGQTEFLEVPETSLDLATVTTVADFSVGSSSERQVKGYLPRRPTVYKWPPLELAFLGKEMGEEGRRI